MQKIKPSMTESDIFFNRSNYKKFHKLEQEITYIDLAMHSIRTKTLAN